MKILQNRGSVLRSRRGWVRWALGGIFILALLALFLIPLVFFGWFAFSGAAPALWRPFFFFPFGFLIFIFIVFVGLRFLFWGWGWGRWRRGYHGWGYGYPDAMDILNQRYAHGDITKDQYDQMRRDIQQQGSQ